MSLTRETLVLMSRVSVRELRNQGAQVLDQVTRGEVLTAFDAMIAATAVAYDLPIYTRNPRDFAGIEGLEVVVIPAAGADRRRS